MNLNTNTVLILQKEGF